MKQRKIVLPLIATIATSAIAIYVLKGNKGLSDYNIYNDDIEALTACESVGWWNNDGNCVTNSSTGEYFCKDDSWPALTDCKR